MPYSAPGKVGELDAGLIDLWNQRLSEILDRQIAYAASEQVPPSGNAWLYNPITAAGAAGEADISWTAFPKRIADESPTMAQAWRRTDENRNNQEEYCEWEVVSDPAQGNKPIRVTFTCETEDYYRFLADHAPDLLLGLYRRHVSPNVRLADLIVDGEYVPQNRWNYPQVNGAHGVLMHMAQRNNSFEAAVNLVGVASWPRVDARGQPITAEQDLITCRPFGDSRRHSDPHIGAEINTLVRGGNEVSFADPVGLYMDSIDLSDWETPDQSDPSGWVRIVRGSSDFMLRIVFEAPAAAAGHVLGDAKIGGRNIRFGGQIAEKIQIRIRGLARMAATAAPRLTCGGTTVGAVIPAGDIDGGGLQPTRLAQSTALLSPE